MAPAVQSCGFAKAAQLCSGCRWSEAVRPSQSFQQAVGDPRELPLISQVSLASVVHLVETSAQGKFAQCGCGSEAVRLSQSFQQAVGDPRELPLISQVSLASVVHLVETSAQDEKVEEMLCEGLQHPDCKIEKLRLEGQFLKESFCRRFAEILRKNQRLRELDLFPDYLDDRVIEMLCKGLKHPDCKIEKLGLGAKFLTQPFSRQFTRVLRMRDLELFPTYREDRAAKMLPAGLKYSNCKLKALRINGEYMKEYLGSQIAGIVKINQKLRELHLHGDCISDYEMKLLWEELKHSGHKLKELWLNGKHIVQKGEWMDPEHAARAPSVNAASSCLLV
ncbi:ribonuclease inhibitor-like [Crotalus adamanteus]|uniref:Ribonuclease inhibitor-like n=1 Tax=Crotalus adamanteus TaxID=8729 RepID=A0AAW1C728_CROAD